MSEEKGSAEPGGRGYEDHLRKVQKRKALLKKELESYLSRGDTIVLEIGCGHGHWLTDYAAGHTDSLCIGIDLIGNRIDRARRKALRAGLSNVRFLKAEAIEFLEGLPEGVSIESVFILFPDPWPKKRHWKNRIMNPVFLDFLAGRCLEAARLHFRSDHSEYSEWVAGKVDSLKKWRMASKANWPFECDTVFQSKAQSYQSMILERQRRTPGVGNGD